MGTGKTLSALWAADYLKQQGVVNRVLIVSPLSTLDVVWGREIFTNFPHRSYAVLHGTSDKRRKLLDDPKDFYILNHHGLKVLEQELIDRPDINLIIFDELAVLRNAQTGLWRSAKKILGPDRWAWGLTGSPTPQAPTDAFGLAKLLKPENVPFSFTRFKNDIMMQCGPFKWVARKNAEQAVARVLSPSIRYALRDCVDLPETIVQYRTVEMTKEQKEHYTKLLKECVTEVRGNAVTAVNAAVLLGKLIQTSAGVLYGADGKVLKLDCEHRIAEVEEIIDECDEKVIVFVPLTGALHAVYNHLKKKYNCGLIEGDTSKHERQRVFDEVQYGDMKVLCANPQAMAHGISLTASSTIVYFAPPFSNEVYEQSAARIVRPGQKNVTNLIHLVSTKEEEKIYKGLQEKKKFLDTVLDIVKNNS
jgi:SNF2 family DNA or RNA helicase